MPQLRFALAESSTLGKMWVAETDAGIAAVSRTDSPEPLLAQLHRRFPEHDIVPAELDVGWLEGQQPRVDLTGLSGFDARIYEVVRAIPSGATMTYGEVAVHIGSPGAARAVGGALSRCPLFPAVPCHRVVRAADGWSGWGGDDRLKRRLLADEAREPTSS